MKERKNFIKYAKAGDPVRYYINKEQHFGVIKEIDVHNIVIDSFGEIIIISRDNVFPILGYKYKKKQINGKDR